MTTSHESWENALPRQFDSICEKVSTGHGDIYVNVGIVEGSGYISIHGGKPDSCLLTLTQSIAYISNVALQHGATLDEIAAQMQHMSCEHSARTEEGDKTIPVLSLPDGIAIALTRAQEKILEAKDDPNTT